MNNGQQQFDDRYIVANTALLDPASANPGMPPTPVQRPNVVNMAAQSPVVGGGSTFQPPTIHQASTKVHWIRIVGFLALIAMLGGGAFKFLGSSSNEEKSVSKFKDVPTRSISKEGGATGTGTAPRAESAKTVKPRTSSKQRGIPGKKRPKRRAAAASAKSGTANAATTGAVDARTANNQRPSNINARKASLPYTGASTWLILLMGGLMFAGGAWVRFNAMNVAVFASQFRRGPALRTENLKGFSACFLSKLILGTAFLLRVASARIEKYANDVERRFRP